MKTKICTKCGIEKPVSEFYFDKVIKKYKSQCKQCCKNYRTLNKIIIKNKKQIYYKNNKKEIQKRTKINRNKAKWNYILSQIKQRCENKNYNKYKDYGEKGIKCLITAEEIKQLMIKDNYWNLKKPSIDRIDNDGNYTLENCRFIEVSENSSKDKRKPVLQFDKNGNFIKEWESLTLASLELKILISGIGHCLKGDCKTYKGFIWKYC